MLPSRGRAARGCHRRRARGAALTAVLTAVLAAFLLPLPGSAVPAQASPTAPDSGPATASPVEVVVEGLAPRAPTSPDEPVQVTGRVVNRGPVPLGRLSVRLAVGGVLTSRSQLARAEQAPPAGRPRGPEQPLAVEQLAPGASTPFDLRLQVRDLRLGALGVYPLQVAVSGRAEGASRTTLLGQADTFLPWFPDGAPRPTRLAFLVPLVTEPERGPDGALLGDRTLAEVSDDGRLAQLLSAGTTAARGACDVPASPAGAVAPEASQPACRGEPVPVTWAVDPDLLETVAALAGEHTVVSAAGERTARAGRPEAGTWLSRLRDSVGDGTPADEPAGLVALPAGDPDVVAVDRTGSPLAGDLEQLRLLGARTAAELTGVEPLTAVAWPPPGRLSSSALDQLAAGGARAVVLDPVALPPGDADANRTPGARSALASTAGRVDGLVADEALSRLLTAGPDDPGWQGDRLAEQRWLAETAIVAAERPGESRTLVVAPSRRAEVRPAVATAALLDAGRLPWLCAVPLADVAAGGERCPAEPADSPPDRVEERGALEPADGEGELSPGYLAQVAAVRQRSTQLTDQVLLAGTDAAVQTRSRLLRARGRALSSAWRQDAAGGRRMLQLQREEVDRLREQVHLVTSGRVLLTGDTGVVEVGLANALDQPVTVGVALNDPVEARLSSSDTAVQTVAPGQQVQVRVRVEARVSGRFVVRATLLDRAGQPFGEPVELIARSTRYGRLAMAVTGVAAGVLLVAVGVRLVRRATRRGPPAPDEP